MSLGTDHCAMPIGIIVRLHLRLECVMESVGHEILQYRQVSGTAPQKISATFTFITGQKHRFSAATGTVLLSTHHTQSALVP